MDALKPDAIQDAVVRLIYRLQADQLGAINSLELYEALAIAHSYTVHADLVSQLARPRLPALTNAKPLDPLEALQFYLDNREDLKDMASDLMTAAESLVGYRLPERSLDTAEANVEEDNTDGNNVATKDIGAVEFGNNTSPPELDPPSPGAIVGTLPAPHEQSNSASAKGTPTEQLKLL